MAEKFKVNDLVEVTEYESDFFKKDWIIVGLASDGGEAIVKHLITQDQAIIKVSKLKHQRRENDVERI